MRSGLETRSEIPVRCLAKTNAETEGWEVEPISTVALQQYVKFSVSFRERKKNLQELAPELTLKNLKPETRDSRLATRDQVDEPEPVTGP